MCRLGKTVFYMIFLFIASSVGFPSEKTSLGFSLFLTSALDAFMYSAHFHDALDRFAVVHGMLGN